MQTRPTPESCPVFVPRSWAPGAHPPLKAPAPSHYQRLGGAPKVRELVDRICQLVDVLPEAYAIRRLRGHGLVGSRERLFDFLSGWLGGPQRYVHNGGRPVRHPGPMGFGAVERDQWLMCIGGALDAVVSDAPLRGELYRALARLAEYLRPGANDNIHS